MKKKILFSIFVLLLNVVFFIAFTKGIMAEGHCTTNSDCTNKNSISSKDGYLQGCNYEIVGGSFPLYTCTPENAKPILTCPTGQHLVNGGAYGTQVCIDDSTGKTTTPADSNSVVTTIDTVYCDNTKTSIKTAIGCINILNSADFLATILKWAIGIGGGIAFILVIFASFSIMTSQGNPDRLQAGRELLTSAIAGLILLILSIFILKFVGIDILGLGKFGFGQ